MTALLRSGEQKHCPVIWLVFWQSQRFLMFSHCAAAVRQLWNTPEVSGNMSRSGSHSHQLWLCLIVAVVVVSVEQVDAVWPLPQQLHQSADRYSLSPQLFSFTYGRDSAAQTGCSVLDAAFKRYFSIIFPDFTTGSGRLRMNQTDVLPCSRMDVCTV